MKILTLFSVVFLNYFVNALQPGQVLFQHEQLSDDISEFYVTNGDILIVAQTSIQQDDMITCDLIEDEDSVTELLSDPNTNVETIGDELIKEMIKKCVHYTTVYKRDTNTNNVDNVDGDYSFNHQLVQGKPFGGDFGTGAPSGAGSHFAIYPGTKWCGYENVASNMSDLGVHNETDACCRTHDHCPYYIDRFETKFHYFNKYPWTLSYCECDQHLYDCLKKVNNPTSNSVGNLFFGLLDVQCFTFQQGSYCENEGSILSHLWCHKTNKGYVAKLQEFPHKWNDADTTDESSDLVG
ncbi:Protein interacting with cyclin A1 [Mactra antiquata]